MGDSRSSQVSACPLLMARSFRLFEVINAWFARRAGETAPPGKSISSQALDDRWLHLQEDGPVTETAHRYVPATPMSSRKPSFSVHK